jgi:hypothetical protein
MERQTSCLDRVTSHFPFDSRSTPRDPNTRGRVPDTITDREPHSAGVLSMPAADWAFILVGNLATGHGTLAVQDPTIIPQAQ